MLDAELMLVHAAQSIRRLANGAPLLHWGQQAALVGRRVTSRLRLAPEPVDALHVVERNLKSNARCAIGAALAIGRRRMLDGWTCPNAPHARVFSSLNLLHSATLEFWPLPHYDVIGGNLSKRMWGVRLHGSADRLSNRAAALLPQVNAPASARH